MNLKPIKNKSHYNQALARINELWGAKRNTEKGDELDVLMLLVEKYEEEHYPIPPSDPVEAIKFLMEQKGLTRKDLEPYLARISHQDHGSRRRIRVRKRRSGAKSVAMATV